MIFCDKMMIHDHTILKQNSTNVPHVIFFLPNVTQRNAGIYEYHESFQDIWVLEEKLENKRTTMGRRASDAVTALSMYQAQQVAAGSSSSGDGPEGGQEIDQQDRLLEAKATEGGIFFRSVYHYYHPIKMCMLTIIIATSYPMIVGSMLLLYFCFSFAAKISKSCYHFIT